MARDAAEAKVSGWSKKIVAEVQETTFAVGVGGSCHCPKANSLLQTGTLANMSGSFCQNHIFSM